MFSSQMSSHQRTFRHSSKNNNSVVGGRVARLSRNSRNSRNSLTRRNRMKNSSASEFNDSTSNINREYSVIDSLLKQRQVNESSIRKISTERRLSRLSSSSKKHQSQLIIPNNSGISWQMTKNLGMTVEERSHCEKKAEKFENKLFDLMKNIE